MITQKYTINREIFEIIIKGKEVFYSDRKLLEPVRMIPTDEKLNKQIILSRNKIDKSLLNQFRLTKEEQIQYDGAITEEELAKISKKDCEASGSRLLKEEITNDSNNIK